MKHHFRQLDNTFDWLQRPKRGKGVSLRIVSMESHERPNEVKETRGKQPQRRKEDRRRGEVGDADLDVEAKNAFSAS